MLEAHDIHPRVAVRSGGRPFRRELARTQATEAVVCVEHALEGGGVGKRDGPEAGVTAEVFCIISRGPGAVVLALFKFRTSQTENRDARTGSARTTGVTENARETTTERGAKQSKSLSVSTA